MSQIKINENWKCENGKYKCPHCGKESSRMGICSHIWKAHDPIGRLHNPNEIAKSRGKTIQGWSKGLTKNTDPRVAKSVNTYKERYRLGLIKNTGHPLSEESKQKISKSMIKAHAEGRAHNIGECRWNNKPSYPEEFFMKVVENEFSDKAYVREFPLPVSYGCLSIDFAWPSKKKAIEIDGAQHERFEKQKLRDQKKENELINQGWTLLRIKWKELFDNTKPCIEKMKNFIDG